MRLLLLALGLIFTSCVNSPLDSSLDGTYRASNGETLVFEQRSVIHERDVDGTRQKTFVGASRNVQGTTKQREISGPDISPFLGTKFVFDQSSKEVSVEWRDFHPQEIIRESNYKKITSGEPQR